MSTFPLLPQQSHYPQTLHRYLRSDVPDLAIQAVSQDALSWMGVAMPSVALFSSAKTPDSILHRVHDLAQTWRSHPLTLISGFDAPAEAEAWSVLWQDVVDFRRPLPKQDAPRLVKVLARGMVSRFSAGEHHALATGQLQLISPFPDSVRRVTKANSMLCNLVAAALADTVLIAHVEPGSQTYELARRVRAWGKPLFSLPGVENDGLLELGVEPLPEDYLR